MTADKPTAEKHADKSTILPFAWPTVIQCLNIGNRPAVESGITSTTTTKGKEQLGPAVGNIVCEDVIEQRIISDGRLLTQKLITKNIGTSRYLKYLGLQLPSTTTVMETSIVDPAGECSWQQTSNSPVMTPELILGQRETAWLTVTETSTYLARGLESTFSHKQVLSQSFLDGFLWGHLKEYLAGKGLRRWEAVRTKQTDRLTRRAEDFIAAARQREASDHQEASTTA